jgi:hypothetical protein
MRTETETETGGNGEPPGCGPAGSGGLMRSSIVGSGQVIHIAPQTVGGVERGGRPSTSHQQGKRARNSF